MTSLPMRILNGLLRRPTDKGVSLVSTRGQVVVVPAAPPAASKAAGPARAEDRQDVFRPEEPPFMRVLRANVDRVLANLDCRPVDLLGHGQEQQIFAIRDPGELQDYVLRVRKWHGPDARAGSRHVEYVDLGDHPWTKRHTVALPVATIGEPGSPHQVSVMKRIRGERLTNAYFEAKKRVENLLAVAVESSSDDAFEGYMAEVPPARLGPVEDFRRAYADYVHRLASLPPSTYYEVAKTLAEGRAVQMGLDFTASSVHLIPPATPGAEARFGFTRIAPLPGVDRPPLDMTRFGLSLLVGDAGALDQDLAGIRRLMGPERQVAFDRHVGVILSKCRAAEQNAALITSGRAEEPR